MAEFPTYTGYSFLHFIHILPNNKNFSSRMKDRKQNRKLGPPENTGKAATSTFTQIIKTQKRRNPP